jgi:membrane peptidoglycan carboxypeptidase
LFLPIYVGLAIENGYQLTSRVNELPIAGGRQSNSAFPTIYEVFLNSNLEHGAILLASLGAGSVAKFAKNLGFDFDLDDLRLALGRGAASSQQVAVAFSAFANEGATVSPYLVWRIEEQNGTVLYQKQESSFVQIISPETSHIVTQGLTHVVNHGVGQGAKISGVEVAGFPGVSSDLQNGWFVGVGNEVVTAVWIGAELGKVKISHQDQDIINFVAKVWKDTFQSLPQLTKIIPPAAAKTNITYSRVYFEDNNPVTLPFLTGQEPQVIKF